MPHDDTPGKTTPSYRIAPSTDGPELRRLKRENAELRAEVRRLRAIASRAGYQAMRRRR